MISAKSSMGFQRPKSLVVRWLLGVLLFLFLEVLGVVFEILFLFVSTICCVTGATAGIGVEGDPTGPKSDWYD